MLKNRLAIICILSLFSILCSSTSHAVDVSMLNFSSLIDRAKITKGRPTEAWNSPLGRVTKGQADKKAQESEEELKKQIDKITEQAEKDKKEVDNTTERQIKQIKDNASYYIKKAKQEEENLSKREDKIKAIEDKKNEDIKAKEEAGIEKKKKIDDAAEDERTRLYNKNEEYKNSLEESIYEDAADEEALNEKALDDTHFNRCRLIKLIKPGADKVEEMQRVATILQAYYSSELYTQAMQILYELDKEDAHPFSNQSSKKAILDKNIKDVLLDATQRLAIVASLEARTAVVENISKLIALAPETYQNEVCGGKKTTSASGGNTQGGGSK